MDLLLDQMDDQLHSSTNPTIKPKATTDEVVAARGSKASLDARLDVSLEEDGTLKTQASLITVAQLQAFSEINFWDDSCFDVWAAGDSSAPTGWTLSGSGAAVARAGSGGGSFEASAPGDTTALNHGRFCVKLTYGSAPAKLTRTFLATMPSGLKSKTITVGIHCKASVVSQASLVVDDGVSTTRAGATGNATYHSGDGTDDWLYCTHTISASATKLDVYLEVASAGTAYFSAGRISFSSVAAADWLPERWAWLTASAQYGTFVASTTTIGGTRAPFPFRVGLFERVSIRAGTAPTGQAAIFDVNKNGTSIYASGTRPQIAAGASTGTDDRPDGTYANRCFTLDDYQSLDCDQVGSGVAGADATFTFRYKVPIDEFAARFGF